MVQNREHTGILVILQHDYNNIRRGLCVVNWLVYNTLQHRKKSEASVFFEMFKNTFFTGHLRITTYIYYERG